ncbi:MAG TPA: DUF6457 domain-containing protein [Micromonosporaceae bacterium]
MGTLEDWTDAVRRRLGLDADLDEALVLDLAREAAHGVARPAAPITTFLFGVAVARGADPRTTAEKIIELARGWEEPASGPDRHRDIPAGE